MTIKYYRKKGTKEATYQLVDSEDECDLFLWRRIDAMKEETSIRFSKLEFERFIRFYDLEEVPEVKLPEVHKSIWKDVSELPEKECQVLVKTCNGIMIGSFRRYIDEEQLLLVVENIGMCGGDIPTESLAISHYGAKKYCTLTDYINDQEQFKQYVLGRLNKEGK